jgi:hypothetical protein
MNTAPSTFVGQTATSRYYAEVYTDHGKVCLWLMWLNDSRGYEDASVELTADQARELAQALLKYAGEL